MRSKAGQDHHCPFHYPAKPERLKSTGDTARMLKSELTADIFPLLQLFYTTAGSILKKKKKNLQFFVSTTLKNILFKKFHYFKISPKVQTLKGPEILLWDFHEAV